MVCLDLGSANLMRYIYVCMYSYHYLVKTLICIYFEITLLQTLTNVV